MMQIKLASAGGVHIEANSSSSGVGIITLDARKRWGNLFKRWWNNLWFYK